MSSASTVFRKSSFNRFSDFGFSMICYILRRILRYLRFGKQERCEFDKRANIYLHIPPPTHQVPFYQTSIDHLPVCCTSDMHTAVSRDRQSGRYPILRTQTMYMARIARHNIVVAQISAETLPLHWGSKVLVPRSRRRTTLTFETMRP